MNKLTAEKCRDRIKRLKECQSSYFGLSIDGEYQLQAYEKALPILEQQERGEGEWIEWGGGQCPVPDITNVRVKLEDGRFFGGKASEFTWVNKINQVDIIAYRIIPERATNQNGEQ